MESTQEKLASTQDGISIDCNYIVLFEWDLELKEPFHLIVRTKNVSQDIPETWLTKSLNESGRLQKRKFKSMENRVFSVYAKMEKGKPFFPF